MKIKIKHKLFATLLLTSSVIAISMFWFMQWSFDRGLLNYVNQQEQQQLRKLSQRLCDDYIEHSNWQFLKNNQRLWIHLHSEVFSQSRRMPPPRPASPNEQARTLPPPPEHHQGIGPRIVLFDADKQKIIGGPRDEITDYNLQPLSCKGEIIGYLSLIPARELSNARDLLFVQQQTKSFALITLAIVILSLLLSFPLTNHLLRPIKALTIGARKLISGQFETRIKVTTSDELGQLSDDFNSLAMSLEENKKIRQQWVADISHELRTPISVLHGDIEALQDGIRQPDAANLERLHYETIHLGRLINDLYELSMSDIGALSYKKINVAPIAILDGTAELFAPRFREKGLSLHTALPVEKHFTMLADPDRLQQLFTNVFENSLRYTHAPGQLNVHISTDNDHLHLHFDDSHPSVTDDQLPKLFDRLYRADSSRNRSHGGAGLGLSICHNIVTAHQGTIKATHSPLGGLSITIAFALEK